MEDERKHKLMQGQADAARSLIEIWGTGAIGPALVTRRYGPEPWVTAGELAEQLHLSAAQTRRRLDELEAAGKVDVWRFDGCKLYAAKPELAERTFEIVRDAAVAFCSGD